MNRGFCLVKFKSRQAAEKVIELKNHTIKERVVTCRDYLKGDQLNQAKESKNSKKIYINNLPSNTTNEDIVKAFSVFGPVEVGYTLKNEDGSKSKGFGFVTFVQHQSSEMALKSEINILIHGKRVEIAPFVSSESKKVDGDSLPLEDVEHRDTQPTTSGSSSPILNSSCSADNRAHNQQTNWYHSNPLQMQHHFAQNMLFWNNQIGHVGIGTPSKTDISYCQPGTPATAWATNNNNISNNLELINSRGISRGGQIAQDFPIRTQLPLKSTAKITTVEATSAVKLSHEVKPTSKLYFTYSRPAFASQQLIFRAEK